MINCGMLHVLGCETGQRVWNSVFVQSVEGNIGMCVCMCVLGCETGQRVWNSVFVQSVEGNIGMCVCMCVYVCVYWAVRLGKEFGIPFLYSLLRGILVCVWCVCVCVRVI